MKSARQNAPTAPNAPQAQTSTPPSARDANANADNGAPAQTTVNPQRTDLTFITNEPGAALAERFSDLLKDAQNFDAIVAYFYISGFHKIYKDLAAVDKIRILVGINADKAAYQLIQAARQHSNAKMSTSETNKKFAAQTIKEMDAADDNLQTEQGARAFIQWLKDEKLEIKAHPNDNLHAKLYIMTFRPHDRDAGRVITGSSNLTQSGLDKNLEFNVELKNPSDYQFARDKFNQLWENAVDVKQTLIETVTQKTWLRDDITPYELYLKFLYEYFQKDLEGEQIEIEEDAPEGFIKLKYQAQAVNAAKRILKEHGGVFLSDVVGLGKTYISALLAQKLDGPHLVIAPPALLDENNPNSWERVFHDFGIRKYTCRSRGKLDGIPQEMIERCRNVFIDESHNFRHQTNKTYEKIAEICRGKRVILVTATPFNNAYDDVLNQIKLFQKPLKSTIPGARDIHAYFRERSALADKGGEDAKTGARRIRDDILKHIMVRRTRAEIEEYFKGDAAQQGLKFPKAEKPEKIYYELSSEESRLFDDTVKKVAQEIQYARYTPLTYYQGAEPLEQSELQAHRNLGVFMKILLVKRLESSLYAFKKSVGRFIKYNELFLKSLQKGKVVISADHANKIFELMERDDDNQIEALIDAGKARSYAAANFKPALKADLQSDIALLKDIQAKWGEIERDPKLEGFLTDLKKDNLKGKKIIIFTESRETAAYLHQQISERHTERVLYFHGSAGANARADVSANFDQNARPENKQDKYDILVTTDVLAEGVNLHRSNIVINYDIPWNPTRMMQRVGRVNRLGSQFDQILTFNCFPTERAEDEIKLKQIAQSKIAKFIELLGADARLLTPTEDITSHGLFEQWTSPPSDDEEPDSELQHFKTIQDIQTNNPELYDKIKELPRKARAAKDSAAANANQLITYFRKGNLEKYFIADSEKEQEIGFNQAAQLLKANPEEQRRNMPADFYDKLNRNKSAFKWALQNPQTEAAKPVQDNFAELHKILRAVNPRAIGATDKKYLGNVRNLVRDRDLPKYTVQQALRRVNAEKDDGFQAAAVVAALKKTIPPNLLEPHLIEREQAEHIGKPRQIILSAYLIGETRDG